MKLADEAAAAGRDMVDWLAVDSIAAEVAAAGHMFDNRLQHKPAMKLAEEAAAAGRDMVDWLVVK